MKRGGCIYMVNIAASKYHMSVAHIHNQKKAA